MSFSDDEGFEPLPPGTEPLDPDDELNLEADAADGGVVLVDVEAPAPLGRSLAFDFATRTLQPADAGGPLMTTGQATLVGWIEKCLNTRRGESIAVDPDFGMNLMPEDLLDDGGVLDPSAVASYLADIARALTQHPRISDFVDGDIDFDEDDGTSLFVTGRVVSDDDDLNDLRVDALPIPIGA